MQLNLRALFSLLPAVVIAPSAISVPRVPRADGYVIVMRITAGPEAPKTITFKTAGDKMRVEADIGSMMGGRGGAAASGMFILPGADGKLTMVMPNAPNPMGGGTGMAVTMDPAGMMAGRGAPPPPVGEVSIEDLGAGESILGHPTHKYRIKPANGDNADLWLATDIAGLDYKKFAGAYGASFTGTDARMAAKIPSGFALKVVSQGKTPVTMEVTKIEKTSFTDAEFQVPPGIQVMDLGNIMGGRGRGNQ